MPTIAVVDDDPEWTALIAHLLKGGGYQTSHYATPGKFLDSLVRGVPDLTVLDMQLPGMHGREVIRVIRGNESTRRLLIVAVSGHDIGSAEAIKAFESGADEYLAKPVDGELLLVRIAALLRRGAGAAVAQSALRCGELTLLAEQRRVTVDGREIALTHLEFDLLAYFVRQAGRVLTRGLLLESVWSGDPAMNTRTVDKHVETLRRKLGAFGARLETVIRVGYVLKPEAPQAARGRH